MTIENTNVIANESPDEAKPSVENAGKMTVGKIANDEPMTIPKIKWYILA